MVVSLMTQSRGYYNSSTLKAFFVFAVSVENHLTHYGNKG